MIELRAQSFDAYAELQNFEARLDLAACGAQAVFIGRLRDFNAGEQVRSMFLEHYPGMTEKYLEQITSQAAAQWPWKHVLLVHRTGNLVLAEAIVLISVWSAHRAEAFAACQFLIDELKHRAPFWKREQLMEQTRWVESNS